MKVEVFESHPPLENQGDLSIFFLGTGSAFSRKYLQTNLVAVKGRLALFIDFGTTAAGALEALGHDLSQVNHLLLTHSHADHIGGVEELALKSRYMFQKKIHLLVTKEYSKILWKESLAGGCKYNEIPKGRKYLTLEDYFHLRFFREEETMEDGRQIYEIEVEGLKIHLFRTKHIPSNGKKLSDFQLSYGMVLDEKVVFTSDTLFDLPLLSYLDKRFAPEIIFHDCQPFEGGVHASYRELNGLPKKIKEKILLVHYSDHVNEEQVKQDGFQGIGKRFHLYIFS
ncbi:MAG: MBL fold metallo-hydrolase [Planctomycetota bacterium]|nr:MAG: MBL fold metallo-hydrolase [Planctomycetota bacterium]